MREEYEKQPDHSFHSIEPVPKELIEIDDFVDNQTNLMIKIPDSLLLHLF